MPETMYIPVAMKKQPVYCTATLCPAISMTCPMIETRQARIPKTARCCSLSEAYATAKNATAAQMKHGIVKAWTYTVDQAGLMALMMVGRK